MMKEEIKKDTYLYYEGLKWYYYFDKENQVESYDIEQEAPSIYSIIKCTEDGEWETEINGKHENAGTTVIKALDYVISAIGHKKMNLLLEELTILERQKHIKNEFEITNDELEDELKNLYNKMEKIKWIK